MAKANIFDDKKYIFSKYWLFGHVWMETILEDNTTDHMSFNWGCKGTPRGDLCPNFWHFFQCIFGQ